jgi:hypothetical protein
MTTHPATFSCDVCGKRRDNDVNKWIVIHLVDDEDFGIREPLGGFGLGNAITVGHWTDKAAKATLAFPAHACGQEHALILVSRWLAHGTFDEERGK